MQRTALFLLFWLQFSLALGQSDSVEMIYGNARSAFGAGDTAEFSSDSTRLILNGSTPVSFRVPSLSLTEPVPSMASQVASKGDLIFAADAGNVNLVLSLRRKTAQFPLWTKYETPQSVFALDILPDLRFVLSIAGDRNIKTRWAADGSVRAEVVASGVIRSRCVAPDGKSVALGFDGGKVRILSLPDLKLLKEITLASSSVYSLAIPPLSPGTLFAGQQNGKVSIVDVSTGLVSKIIPVSTSFVTGIASSSSGSVFAALDLGFVRLVDSSTGEIRWKVPAAGCTCIAFSPDGEWIGVGPKARLFDMTGRVAESLIELLPYGTNFAWGHPEVAYKPETPFVKLVQTDAGLATKSYGWDFPVQDFVVSGDSQALAGRADGDVHLLDLTNGVLWNGFVADAVGPNALSPDHATLAYPDSGAIQLVSTKSGERVGALTLPDDVSPKSVSSIVFAPGGDYLVCTVFDGTSRLIYRIGDQKLLRRFSIWHGEVLFPPGGKTVVFHDADTLYETDLDTGAVINSVRGPYLGFQAAFDSTGRTIYSCGTSLVAYEYPSMRLLTLVSGLAAMQVNVMANGELLLYDGAKAPTTYATQRVRVNLRPGFAFSIVPDQLRGLARFRLTVEGELQAEGELSLDQINADHVYKIYRRGNGVLEIDAPACLHDRYIGLVDEKNHYAIPTLIWGDFDRDNEITVFDYSILSDLYLTHSGKDNWDVVDSNGFAPYQADISNDGVINSADFGYFKQNFGKSGD